MIPGCHAEGCFGGPAIENTANRIYLTDVISSCVFLEAPSDPIGFIITNTNAPRGRTGIGKAEADALGHRKAFGVGR